MKLLTIVIALLICTQVNAKQKFYKWVDEDGNIHYTEKKPKDQNANQIKVYQSKSTPVAAKEQDIKQPEQTNQELTAEQKATNEFNQAEQIRVQKIQDRENCKIAKQNKITLEKSASIKKKNPATGEYVRMDRTEVNKKLQEVIKSIRKLCR